ncbi:MAG: hypothetical protein HYU88_10495 [Chloroflexi bacterium]|nr:hypothetical protein [Chloroflexota bacterium]
MALDTFEIELLDPIEQPLPAPTQLAPRLTTLAGRTVGLLENTKYNSRELLDDIAEVLQRDYGVRDILRRSKESASRPAAAAVYDELAAHCDAVITGIGD